MPFARRLALFIFGILLGSVFVYAILVRGRSFPAWLPSDRVMEALREYPIQISAQLRCELACLKLENQDVASILADEEADVLFDESDIRGKEKPEYVIEGKIQSGKKMKMKFRAEGLSTRALGITSPEAAARNCKP